MPQFTWIPIYREIAEKLLPFEQDRQGLIAIVKNLLAIGLPVFSPTDRDSDDNEIPLTDIDPFTFFAIWNRGIREQNRKDIIAKIQEFLGIPIKPPDDFTGIPLMNNQRSWFFSYKKERKPEDIPHLWRLFREAMSNAINPDTFNTVLNIRFVKYNITMGLFWIDPDHFLNLDGVNREYLLAKNINVENLSDYEQYCKYMDAASDAFTMPFYELSYNAWLQSKQTTVDIPTDKGSATRYWLYAPGGGAEFWDEFYSQGIMAIGWDDLGDLSTYEDKESVAKELRIQDNDSDSSKKNNATSCYSFANDIQKGDIVFAKAGRRRIVGWGVVVSDYIFADSRPSFKHTRMVDWKAQGDWEVSVDNRFALKTLTDITKYPDFVTYLKKLITGQDVAVPDSTIAVYTKEQAYSELFVKEEAIDKTVALLLSKKNIILQGPPGVGKTYFAKRLAYTAIGKKDNSKIQMIQFHQSYSYEDFMQGYRPTPEGRFELKNGIFYSFCRQAQLDENSSYFFIIDEINRGNLSKIFGELMMLIECDKRGREFALPLTYAQSLDDKFYIPENLHIIGTMNTADRSLAMVDYALRRRFCFVDLVPAFVETKYKDSLLIAGADANLVSTISLKMEDLNNRIEQDKNLGKGFKIGHSYFCPQKGVTADADWFKNIIYSEIEPLLQEYWFDNPVEAQKAVERLFS